MAGILARLEQFSGPRGAVDGIISEPAVGLYSPWGGSTASMRILSSSDIRAGDLLIDSAGSRYIVSRTWTLPGGQILGELVKES